MEFVKGGSFTMGTNGIKGVQLSPMEKPAHEVSVADFYIGRYEVSQKEQILEKWGVKNVFYGTGNPDEPRLTNSCELPFCWEQNNYGSKKI